MNELLTSLERASLQGGVALLVVWLLCRWLSRLSANVRCWLWRLAFVKCLAALFLALTVAVPILPTATPPVPAVTVPADVARDSPPPIAETIPTGGMAETTTAAVSAEARTVTVTSEAIPSPWSSFPFWLTMLYALGVSVPGVLLALSGMRTRKLVRRAEAVEHPALAGLARQFGCRTVPHLARSSEIDGPLLAFSTILLPAEPSDDEPLMLGHELAHFRRRDLAWEWLGTLTQVVFWFHPLVWMARREERMAREQAADALAIAVMEAPPAEYARALLSASLRRNGKVPTLAVGAVEGGSRLRQRLEALTRPGLPRRRAIALGGIAAVVAIVACVPWKAVARQEQPPPPAASNIAETKAATQETSVVRCIVRYPNGTPADGMYVQLVKRPFSEQTPWRPSSTPTDTAGMCEVGQLETGTYLVFVMSPLGNYISPEDVLVEVPGKSMTVTKEVMLVRAAKITGLITDKKGRPLRGVAVNSGPTYLAASDHKGRYTLVVPPGRVEMTIAGMGPKTVLADAARPAKVNATLPNGVFRIHGSVLDSTGQPVRATFKAWNDSFGAEFSGQASGQFDWRTQFFIPKAVTVFAYTDTEGAVATVAPGQDQPLRLQLSPKNVGFITFRVTTADNSPIPPLARMHRIVIEISGGRSSDQRRLTAPDGRGQIAVLPNEPCRLKVRAQGYHPQNLVAAPGNEEISLRPGETKDLGTVVLAPITDVASGQLRDAENRPIPRGQFMLHTQSDSWEGVTDAEGRFAIRGVKKGESCRLWFIRQENGNAKTWTRHNLTTGDMGIITPTPTASPIPVSPGNAVAVSRSPRGSLSGAVTDAEGMPVREAKVSWVVPGRPYPKIIAETTTNQYGEFQFTGITNGTPKDSSISREEYWKNYLNGWVTVQATGHGLGVQRVRYPATIVRLQLKAPQTYTAVFRDTQGRPLAGMPVRAAALRNNNSAIPLHGPAYAGKTDARGEFRVSGLPKNDAVSFQFDENRWSIADRELDVNPWPILRNGRAIYTLDKGHGVEGTVHVPDGRPAPGIEVILNPISPGSWRSSKYTRTDEQGNYRVMGLGAEEYRIAVRQNLPPNVVPPLNMTIRIPESAATVRKDITLEHPATVTGRVVDTNGKPLAGMQVSTGTPLHATTDPDGRYTLAIPAGSVTLSVHRVSKTVTPRRDRPTTVDFTVPPQAHIRGQVVNGGGLPLAGMSVWVRHKQRTMHVVTDAQGMFSWEFMPDGAGPITVFTERDNEGAYVTLRPGEDKPLRLQVSKQGIATLTGRVTDAAGKPIPRLLVEVVEGDFRRPCPYATDGLGNFRVSTRPGEPVRLRFSAEGYVMTHAPRLQLSEVGGAMTYGKGGFTLPAGASKELGRIVLKKASATATGILLDPQKKPLAFSHCFLITESGEWEGFIEMNGAFQFPGVIKGERAVLVALSRKGDAWHTWIRRGLTVGEMGTITLTERDRLR